MAGYEKECLTEHDLEEQYGNLYALVKGQMPDGNYAINVGQMQKVMRIVVFFDSVMECEGGSWQRLQFDNVHDSFAISMSFMVFDEDFRMQQMCEAFAGADEFVVCSNSADTFYIECRVYDVVNGIVNAGNETQSVPVEMIIAEEYRVKDTGNEKVKAQFAIDLNKAIQKMLSELDNSDYVENPIQLARFNKIYSFLKRKANELGGKIEYPDLVPKEQKASLLSEFPVFELKGDEVKEFFGILMWANTIGIYGKICGDVIIDMNVPNVFVHK